MLINKYRAKDLKTAIQKAKEDLGPEASMIHLRELDNCEEKIEIIATIDDELEKDDRVLNQRIDNIDKIFSEDTSIKAIKCEGKNLDKQTEGNINRVDIIVSEDTKVIGPEEDGKTLGKDKFNKVNIDDKLLKKTNRKIEYITKKDDKKTIDDDKNIFHLLHDCCIRNCIRNRIDSDITNEMLSFFKNNPNTELPKSATYKDYLFLFMNKKFDLSGGLDTNKKTVILIGPTGVGKTTTLAKIAAQYHFYQSKSVGIITIDAYRIAAIEQLKTYAQIMSIPFKVALTPEELKLAIRSYENRDLILIDTPGHSQFNKKALDNLEEFLVVAQPADIHLLIALTMKEEDAYFTLDNFAPEYVHQIIFTKLDETSSFGSILNMSNKAKMPISYLTIGQNVPDDIKTANFDFMIDLLLHGQNSIKTI